MFSKTSKFSLGHILCLTLLFLGCKSIAETEWGKSGTANPISMIDLISNGDQYNKLKVRVSGVIHVDFETSLIFFSKETYENFDTTNSILLDISNSDLDLKEELLEEVNGAFVMIEGDYIHVGREKLEDNEFIFGSHYVGIVTNISYVVVY